MTGNIITEYLLTLNSMQDDSYQDVVETFIRKTEANAKEKFIVSVVPNSEI